MDRPGVNKGLFQPTDCRSNQATVNAVSPVSPNIPCAFFTHVRSRRHQDLLPPLALQETLSYWGETCSQQIHNCLFSLLYFVLHCFGNCLVSPDWTFFTSAGKALFFCFFVFIDKINNGSVLFRCPTKHNTKAWRLKQPSFILLFTLVFSNCGVPKFLPCKRYVCNVL